jgi:hypothetical protein
VAIFIPVAIRIEINMGTGIVLSAAELLTEGVAHDLSTYEVLP